MKITFVSSSILDYKIKDSTPMLLAEAIRRCHEVFVTDARSICIKDDGFVYAESLELTGLKFRSRQKLIDFIKSNYEEKRETECLSKKDTVFFRSISPSVGIPVTSLFVNVGQILESQGVFVANSPKGIIAANSKLYISKFPQSIRPRMLVTRSKKEIKKFFSEIGKPIIIKPLRGHGGNSVFRVGRKTASNLNAIIETVTKKDYAVVQEFVSVKKKGDKRILMLKGKVIKSKGQHAVYFRQAPKDDIRSNMHVGAEKTKCRFTKTDELICNEISKFLVDDGLFLVGIDIIGDKILEVNVMCPGGICAVKSLYGINCAEKIIKGLEKEVSKRNKGTVSLTKVA